MIEMTKYSNNKDINLLVTKLIRKGFDIRRGGKHSFVIFSNVNKVMVPSTPSDKRAYYNFKNQVQKCLNGNNAYENQIILSDSN